MVNNYLANIAARTLNPGSAIRPRLRGRFEPARVLREPSIDPSESFPRVAAKHSEPYSHRDRADAWEIPQQPELDHPSEESFDSVPQLDLPKAITRKGNTAAPDPDSVVQPSAPLGIRTLNQQTPLEFPRENLRVDVRPVEKLTAVAGTTESKNIAPPQARAENRLEPQLEKLPVQAAASDEKGTEKAAVASPTRRSLKINKRSLRRDDEEEIPAQLVVSPQSGVERELETIVIREESTFDESKGGRQPGSSSPPRDLVLSSEASEPATSKASPTFTPSPIAPLIESRPDLLPLNRPQMQPPPTIHVTIGRLEVRAVQSSPSPAKSRAASQPVMNLDDYLRRRSQGDGR